MNEQQHERAIAKMWEQYDGYEDRLEALKQHSYEPPSDEALEALVLCGENVLAWISEAAPMLRKVEADSELVKRMRLLAQRVADQTATLAEARAFVAAIDDFIADVDASMAQWQADTMSEIDSKLDD